MGYADVINYFSHLGNILWNDFEIRDWCKK
jgi:hypothetical protein